MFLSVVGDDHDRQPAFVRGRQETFENRRVGDVSKNDERAVHGSFLGATVARPGESGNWFAGAQVRGLEAVVDA